MVCSFTFWDFVKLRCLRGIQIIFILFLSMISVSQDSDASNLKQWSGIIDVHSTFSQGGKYSIQELAEKARSLGLNIVVLTDHLRVRMEYGVPPFRNVVKLSKERKSVHQEGIKKYLSEIRSVNQLMSDLIVIPGFKVAPYYYWTGSYFDNKLTANSYNKQLLVTGLTDPQEIRGIPGINRPGFSTNNMGRNLLGIALFLLAIILALFLLKERGVFRAVSFGIIILAVMGIANGILNPDPSPYAENQGIRPFQEVIDYVNKKGGMTFWVQPGTALDHKIGPVLLKTPAHDEDLVLAQNYTGFEGIYGEDLIAKNPGQEWDVALVQFCKGERKVPPVVISGLDYYEGNYLSDFQTIFLASSLDNRSILTALREGRIYAVRQHGKVRPVLNDFSVRDTNGKILGIMGDRIVIDSPPVISIKISYDDENPQNIRGILIRSGKVIHTFGQKTPLDLKFHDKEAPKNQWIYYRLIAGGIISNPVFVKLADSG